MLKNLRIVFYFRTIVIGLCLSILLLSGLSWWATSTASASLHAVHGERMAKVDRLSQIAENITKNRLEIMLMFQHDPQGALHGVHDHAISVHFERYAKRREETSRLWQEVQDTPMDDAEHALFAQAAEARKAWVPKADLALESVRHDQYSSEVMAAYLKAGREEGDAMMKAIDALTKYQASAAAEAAAAADRRHRTAGIMFGLVLFGLGVPVMVVSLRLLHRLRRGFAKANSSAQLIAQGDLTVHIESDGRNEIGELLLSMEQMRRNLTQVIGQVRGAADSIELAAAEVAAGNADLSQRTEQTASNLQQTASSASQLGEMVRENAASAHEANQLAQSASEVASKGGEAVAQVVDTMHGINDSSRRIADIIGVIDGIAFQTNILALNAAVEAARAGEQGRGFAVVAGEVRSLAQRSAEAAREIKELIAISVERVDEGSRQVDQAGATMKEVVSSIHGVSATVGRISAASSAQSEGVEQVGRAVNQMDAATQQNAALVEQSAAAAESLRNQAQQLVAAVATFRVTTG